MKNYDVRIREFYFKPMSRNSIIINAPMWEMFLSSQYYIDRKKAIEKSYFWDEAIIEYHLKELTSGRSLYVSGDITEQETQFRLLAGESRERREMLSNSAIGLLKQKKLKKCTSRIAFSIDNNLPTYVFIIYYPENSKTSTKKHEKKARSLLEDFLYATTTRTPNNSPVVGIMFTSESGQQVIGSLFPDTFTENERKIAKIKLKYLEENGLYSYKNIIPNMFGGYCELVQ